MQVPWASPLGAPNRPQGEKMDQPFAAVMYCSVQKGCFKQEKIFEYSF